MDPLAGYNPIFEVEHYIDGQHNGGVLNNKNLNVYGYTYQNPIRYIDPNGKQVDVTLMHSTSPFFHQTGKKIKKAENSFQVYAHSNSNFIADQRKTNTYRDRITVIQILMTHLKII